MAYCEFDYSNATLVIADSDTGENLFEYEAAWSFQEPVDEFAQSLNTEWSPDTPIDRAYDILRGVNPSPEMLAQLNDELKKVKSSYYSYIYGIELA